MDENRLGARLKRYSQVGLNTGKIAGKMVGRRLTSSSFITEAGARELKLALGNLKGPIMKVAQIMATIPDALPEDLAQELAELQSNAPPMGWSFVKRRMANELGKDWQKSFEGFDKEAGYAASLGQVHHAQLPDGTPVVCKLQYPDMSSIIEADLKQLKLIFALYRQYDKAIKTHNIQAELAERLREELDYRCERRNMSVFHEILSEEPHIHVPKAFENLSSDRLLTMTFLPGRNILDVLSDTPSLTNTVSKQLFKAWYKPLYHYGVIHGDPHLGNYTVTDEGDVNLLDFGCVRFFEGDFVAGILQLYEALRDGDKEKCIHAYESWGFEGLSRDVIDVLNKWAQFVYTPLLDDRVRRIHDTDDGLYGARVANEIHRELKRLGGIAPPREFVLVDRAAVGLGSVFMRTKAELNWYQLFNELIEDFTVQILNDRQRSVRELISS